MGWAADASAARQKPGANFREGQHGVTRIFWWFHETNRAVRVGDWKLVSLGGKGPWELYNLREDRTEMKDLAASIPTKCGSWKKYGRRRWMSFGLGDEGFAREKMKLEVQ